MNVFILTPILINVQVQGNDPSCLREFLLQILHRNSSSGNAGLQVFTVPSVQISNFKTFIHLCENVWFIMPCRYLIGIGVQGGTFYPCC